MSISIKQADPPALPPARLYLEDIEEIVSIFRTLVDRVPNSGGEDPAMQVTCSIGDHICDSVSDLPKIARLAQDLEIEVRKGSTAIKLNSKAWCSDSYLHAFVLDENVEREAYDRVMSIFKKGASSGVA